MLGIETSCDDTCVGIVKDGKEVLSHEKSDQGEFHRWYGGVVPEIASRKHLEMVLVTLEGALKKGHCGLEDIDLICATSEPGLVGSLQIGVNVAKSLAFSLGKAFLPINHLAGHLYSLHLEQACAEEFLGVIVSGGHTLLVHVKNPLEMTILGTTLDDAIGEVFDKIGYFFKLGYPGGPLIEKKAKRGNAKAYKFPMAKIKDRDNPYAMSYSGLKTAVIHNRRQYRAPGFNHKDFCLNDLLASFQKSAFSSIVSQSKKAAKNLHLKTVGVCGGVAASKRLQQFYKEERVFSKIIFPKKKTYCVDNAAMIAGLGGYVARVNPEILKGSFNEKSEYLRQGSRSRLFEKNTGGLGFKKKKNPLKKSAKKSSLGILSAVAPPFIKQKISEQAFQSATGKR